MLNLFLITILIIVWNKLFITYIVKVFLQLKSKSSFNLSILLFTFLYYFINLSTLKFHRFHSIMMKIYNDYLLSAGISSLASCGTVEVEHLPQLPAGEEQRLQRAAQQLQQRLVLREWLRHFRLHQYYQR